VDTTWPDSVWTRVARLARARRWRLLIGLGSAVLIGATLLPWWGVGGAPGTLPARGSAGISDATGVLVFLAGAACLLLASVRFAAGKPVWIDRLGAYGALLAVAVAAYAFRAQDLAGRGLLPSPDRGPGFWLAPVGLALVAAGIVARALDRGSAISSEPEAEPDADGEAAEAEASGGPAAATARGRLDRLDVWVVAALLVAVLASRVYALGQPPRMYFDEVYHARGATEFLQDWRYGIPHDIYEWTHPMLAKYAIAGGIALFDDYRVTATADLGVPVKDAIVEEAWGTDTGTVGGDRVFVATGSDVRVFDLSTRALVHTYAIPGASALSEPTAAGLVFVGTADGSIYRIDTRSLDPQRAGTASAVEAPELLEVKAGFAIARAFAGSEPYLLVSDWQGNVVSIDTSVPGGEIVARALIPGAAGFADFGVPNTQPGVRLLVAYLDGVAIVQAGTLAIESTVSTDSPATSVAFNREASGGLYSVYVAAGRSVILVSAEASPDAEPLLDRGGYQPLATMPNVVTSLVFDEATGIVHALGRTPDGAGWTVYAIESNGNAVFSDAPLPFQPIALGLDNAVSSQPSGSVGESPQLDREELFAFGANGAIASVDVGQFTFSWRIVGVLFGALMAVCLYLLARILFRRRSIGLLAAFFSVVDGMLFAQSRMATNDTYVGGLLALAFLIFAVLWLEVPRRRLAFWLGMPALGVVFGLALGAKWEAFFAIACIATLILIRSALGRLVAVLGLCAATGVLGWLAISDSAPNFTFFAIMLAITALAAAASARRPIAWTRDELRFAVAGPPVLGFLGPLVVAALSLTIGMPLSLGPLLLAAIECGVAGLAVGLVLGLAFWLAGHVGLGPLAASAGPRGTSPAPTGWLRPGWGYGIPAAWTLLCLAILPLAIYVALYVPWSMPWQQQAASAQSLPAIACWQVDGETGQCTDAWPSGHTGQTLWDLTVQMYDYQNDLRASHPASSPWWSWPLDLRPVWLESGSTSSGLVSAIYDRGNVVLWWLAIPGMGFAVWQAFKRRGLGLGLVVVAFFWQWLAWARIDRATFEYHFFAALPFFLLGLAYFLAELWHGPSRRTWLLARVGLAGAMLLPAALWLARPSLCGLAGVDSSDYFGATICGSGYTGPAGLGLPGLLIPALLVAGLVGALLALAVRVPRHLVAGVCALAALFFAFYYPNLAAVPLPTPIQSDYMALTPTWLYGFQFATDLRLATAVQVVGVESACLVGVALVVAACSTWLARVRATEAEPTPNP
jgi:hypothetical protein